MTIKQKIIYGFVAIAILMTAFGAIQIYRQLEYDKEHAILHAEIAARMIALSISREEEETNIPAIYTNPINLQEYVKDFHEINKLDLVVVDRNKKILADVISHNVGTIFDHDQGNEVGQTIKDGATRTFIEKSPDYPEGIRQLVIPFKSEQGAPLGAVIIEYTPFYDEEIREAVGHTIYAGAIAIASILFAMILGYKISMAIANPVNKLKEAAADIAGGNLDVRIEVITKDEIGDLAVSFNKMALDLKKTRDELIVAKEYTENIVNSMINSLIVVSSEGKIQYVNPITCSLLGYEENEIVGQHIGIIFAKEEELLFRGSGLADLIKKGTARDLEKTYLSKNGKEIPVLFSMSVMQDKEEKIQGIVCVAQDISERKRSEGKILRQGTLLAGINEVLRGALICETEEEFTQKCLSVAEGLTGSKFGFIGEVNKECHFDTIALSDPGWAACKMPKSEAPLLIKNMEIRGIWSGVIKGGKSQIINDPSSHPDRVGIPEGHPFITSFLGVPLKYLGNTIGLISLGNKESGFNLEDQEDMETLSIAFVEALMRRRAEMALEESEEREKRTARENANIAEIGRIISSNRNIDQVYGRFAEEVRTLIPCNGIAINIINHEEGTVTVPYVSGVAVPGCQPGDVFSLEGSITGEVMRTRSKLIIQT